MICMVFFDGLVPQALSMAEQVAAGPFALLRKMFFVLFMSVFMFANICQFCVNIRPYVSIYGTAYGYL